eukprot:COSAG01_NODE_25894_length_730_cov_0.668780_2_plen_55_part_01
MQLHLAPASGQPLMTAGCSLLQDSSTVAERELMMLLLPLVQQQRERLQQLLRDLF